MHQLPTHQAIRELLEGMLGRDVTLAYGKGLRPDSTPAPSIGVYVDDRGTMTALVLFDFALTAYAGAALGLVPAGGAEAAIEDRDIPDSLQENAYELLNVFAGALNQFSDTHQKLSVVHRPGDTLPADVAEWANVVTQRDDLKVTIKGYGDGGLAVVSVLPLDA
ncbi:hypothetical protein [Angustibacter aerolatus]